jgi:diadenosine tetraphosphate (Ap4A) HIT family hydrolase
MNNNVMNEFKSKFRTEELRIYETDHWIWSLRPVQCTLGAGILSLKRECTVFSGLKKEEFLDLNNVIILIEKTLKKAFSYDIMNYLMLMMVDKQVHFHVIPRYEKTLDFIGRFWEDSGWPGVPNLAVEELELKLLEEILFSVKCNLIV